MRLTVRNYLLSGAVAAIVAGPWMLRFVTDYTRQLFESVPYLIG